MNLQQREVNCVNSFATVRFHLQQTTIATEEMRLENICTALQQT
jgi:hypothetical protein